MSNKKFKRSFLVSFVFNNGNQVIYGDLTANIESYKKVLLNEDTIKTIRDFIKRTENIKITPVIISITSME